jgi:6-hydroxy-3-succinoylpyridine 3-monooxygenase
MGDRAQKPPQGGFAFLVDSNPMRSNPAQALRTRVYVDGYNLYFGCLKNTPYKWLDIRLLIEKVLASVSFERDGKEVEYRLATPAIKYFTALILESFAKSADSMHSQIHYHDALAGYLGEDLEMISGYYHALFMVRLIRLYLNLSQNRKTRSTRVT